MSELKGKLEKLIWMSLDQGGNDHQMDQAAAMLFRLCRNNNISAKDFFKMFGGEFNFKEQLPSALHCRMPFGKWRDFTMREIAQNQPGYLTWCLENIHDMNDELRTAMETTLDYYAGINKK